MNWLFFHSLIIGACTIVLITSAPTADDTKTEKRDVKSSEMDEILSDDLKHKRSQEVIMFGNQQNKPAGMVDDALIGFVDKKSEKNQDEDEEDNEDSSDETTPYNSTDKKNSKVPVVAEVGTDEQESAEEPFVENDDVSSSDNEQLDNESYLQRNFHNGYQYDEADDMATAQRLEDKNINNINDIAEDWLEYGNNQRKRRNIKRSTRHFQKRSLLTPLDKLMNLRHGARWKRDSKFREDDVVGLLGLLAAAEVAKERQEMQRHHNLEELEAAYKESLGRPDYSRFDEPRNFDLAAENYGYYPVRYDESDEDNDEENPDVAVLDREISIKRRSNPFYPPVDYRSLGIIGNKKRNVEIPHHPGLWGRIEQRKHSLFNEPDVVELAEILQNQQDAREDFSDEDEDDDRDMGSEEDKLYTLGELLNGIDVENSRYPYYRQFN